MHPGLANTECWLAALHYRELVAEGQRQQFVERALLASHGNADGLAAIRHRMGALLIRAVQHFDGANIISVNRLGPVVASERNAGGA